MTVNLLWSCSPKLYASPSVRGTTSGTCGTQGGRGVHRECSYNTYEAFFFFSSEKLCFSRRRWTRYFGIYKTLFGISDLRVLEKWSDENIIAPLCELQRSSRTIFEGMHIKHNWPGVKQQVDSVTSGSGCGIGGARKGTNETTTNTKKMTKRVTVPRSFWSTRCHRTFYRMSCLLLSCHVPRADKYAMAAFCA